MKIYNCHMHIFTIQAVPVGFVPVVTRLAQTRAGNWTIEKLLKMAIPYSSLDSLHRFAQFVEIGGEKTQESIFQEVRRFYPEGTAFVALTMDMAYMNAGAVPQSYIMQLDEVANIKRAYGDRILPFICVDARREGILEIVKHYIEERGFHGIKLYPPLGFFPYDSRLDPVWEYAQSKQIPVVTHLSKGGVHYRGKIRQSMMQGCELSAEILDKLDKPYHAFSHPANYRILAERFPNLKISFGHCGGDKEWASLLLNPPIRTLDKPKNPENWLAYALDLVSEHKQFYADISYTLNDKRFFSLLKVVLQDAKIRKKILFGSDYYMVRMDTSEKTFSIDLRAFLGESDFKQIAETNPKQFLRRKL